MVCDKTGTRNPGWFCISDTRINSLYLIDPWKHLFHPPPSSPSPSSAQARDAKPWEETKRGGASTDHIKLHKPRFRFQSNPGDNSERILAAHPSVAALLRANRLKLVQDPTTTTHPFFFSGLLREDTLLLADSSAAHSAFLYDADLNSEMPINPMRFPKGPDCVCFSAPQRERYYPLENTHCLFVLDLSPPPNAIGAPSTFEVLTYFCDGFRSQPQLNPNYKNTFFWRTLPSPPFHCGAGTAGVDACSFMMVDGSTSSTISVSSAEEGVAGTYAFDMATIVWTRAGDWVLPFYGKAEHVPELGLSFALMADNSPHRRFRLCALEHVDEGPPTVRHTFDEYLDLPEKLSPYKCRLLNLGSGSFCVVSFCKTRKGHEFTVLTGLEVKPCDDGLRMIKHLSKCISLGSHSMISNVL